ncbi:MAG: cysteine desulfurase [Methanomicrobiales archaeon]|nr:cysteine desulfurase [Methanomicrobiales archaeon]
MYDLATLRDQFPVLSTCIYLDSAATSQTPRCAVEAMNAYFFEYAANHGRGAHRLARRTTEEFERTRERLGVFLGVPAANVVFTRNTTDAINLVARGICWKEGDEVVTTDLEHHANLLPWLALRERGVRVKIVSQRNGYIGEEELQEAVGPATRLVAVNHMTNVLGTVLPVDEFAHIAHDAGAAILVDAAQSAGHLPMPRNDLFDYLALPGHKGLLGPQGTGAVYISDPDSLAVTCYGGGMVADVTVDQFTLLPCPARFEPGTPNIPGVIGLGAAIGLVGEIGVDAIHRHEVSIGRWIHTGLSDIAGVTVYSPPGSTVISFNIDGMGPDVVALLLDHKAGICVRSGMHCAQPLSQSLHPKGTVRASVGCYTTKEEVDIFVRTVEEIVREKTNA